MTSLLEFECRVPVDGYRILSLDERKLSGADLDIGSDDFSVLPPEDATEDERYLLHRWGMRIVPSFDPELIGFGIEPEVRELLEPQSEEIRRFDLFEEDPDAYIEFANSPVTLDDAEGARALASRFGPLLGGERPEYVDTWCLSAIEMRKVVAAWKRAKTTDDFRRIARSVSRQQMVSYNFGRLVDSDKDRIGATISFRENPKSGAPLLRISPTTLLAALWTQLAQAVHGSQSLRTCIECKKWFTLKSGQGRSDKEYCSNACRMRAYRKRKSETLKNPVKDAGAARGKRSQ